MDEEALRRRRLDAGDGDIGASRRLSVVFQGLMFSRYCLPPSTLNLTGSLVLEIRASD